MFSPIKVVSPPPPHLTLISINIICSEKNLLHTLAPFKFLSSTLRLTFNLCWAKKKYLLSIRFSIRMLENSKWQIIQRWPPKMAEDLRCFYSSSLECWVFFFIITTQSVRFCNFVMKIMKHEMIFILLYFWPLSSFNNDHMTYQMTFHCPCWSS